MAKNSTPAPTGPSNKEVKQQSKQQNDKVAGKQPQGPNRGS